MLNLFFLVGVLSWISLFAHIWLALMGYLDGANSLARFFSFLMFLALSLGSVIAIGASEKIIFEKMREMNTWKKD